MTAPTHRYVGTGLTRASGGRVEHGDHVTPTDAELRAFGDHFEELPEPHTADDPATDDPPPGGAAGAVLESHGVDPDDYHAMRAFAGNVDGVNGNLPEADLREALARSLSDSEV